jgi:hypothetical protein
MYIFWKDMTQLIGHSLHMYLGLPFALWFHHTGWQAKHESIHVSCYPRPIPHHKSPLYSVQLLHERMSLLSLRKVQWLLLPSLIRAFCHVCVSPWHAWSTEIPLRFSNDCKRSFSSLSAWITAMHHSANDNPVHRAACTGMTGEHVEINDIMT